MTKVDIISGFLGAGKTTFIKELIGKVFKDEKIVLIENEFGEIGIDSRFMKDAGIEVTEMDAGCICCTLVGDFAKALQQVVEEYQPDRVIIEPSGVGKLSDVAKAVEEMQGTAPVEINSRITVVDGKKAKMHMKNFGEFFNDQIESASAIVISRTQLMDEEKLKECVAALRAHNQEASIITTPWEQLSGEMIADAICHGQDHHHHHEEHGQVHHHDDGSSCCCGCGHDHDHHHHGQDHHHEGHHHADEVFSSWGIETVHKFDRRELEDVLQMLSKTEEFGTVLRAKGIVQCLGDQWVEFDMVPEEMEIRNCQPDYTGRICVIGTELKTEDLNQVFGN